MCCSSHRGRQSDADASVAAGFAAGCIRCEARDGALTLTLSRRAGDWVEAKKKAAGAIACASGLFVEVVEIETAPASWVLLGP